MNIIQVNKIYLKDEEQQFYTNNTIFYNQLDNNYYSSQNTCNSSLNVIQNTTHTPQQVEILEKACLQMNFNQTNLLKQCKIRVDTKFTTLQCHNKLFYINNNNFLERLGEVKLQTNSSALSGNEAQYYKLKISGFFTISQDIKDIQQNEHQTCYIKERGLQCLYIQDEDKIKLNEQLFLMNDRFETTINKNQKDSKQKKSKKRDYNLNEIEQNDESYLIKSETSIPDQLEEQKENRTIIGFSQISYQSGRSVMVFMPKQNDDEDLCLITIHTDKYFYDFANQQSTIKFNTKNINYDLSLNKFIDIQTTFNSIRGTINIFLVSNNGVWIFELSIDFIFKSEIRFVQRIETKVDLFSVQNNIITIFNKSNQQLSAYRIQEFSYNIQTIFVKENINSVENKSSEQNKHKEQSANSKTQQEKQEQDDFILRLFINKKNKNRKNKHNNNQYLIYLVHAYNLTQTIVSIQEFNNDQRYLLPLYNILDVNQKIDINYKINKEDFKGMNLVDNHIEYTKLTDSEKSNQIIIDLQNIKEEQETNVLIYSTNHAVFIQPICFPNNHLRASDNGDVITSYTYSGCKECKKSTYSTSINQVQCLNIKSNNFSKSQIENLSNFELINYPDTCQNNQQKGPLCQTCSEYQQTFLPNEKYIQLLNTKTYLNQNQIICPYSCNQQNNRQTMQYDASQDIKENINLFNISEEQNKNQKQQKNQEQGEKTLQNNNGQVKEEKDLKKQIENKNNIYEHINTETECVLDQQKQEYNNFCSKFTDCYECSHHPFCIYNLTEKKCQQLKKQKLPQNLNLREFYDKYTQTQYDRKSLLEYQKYEICNFAKKQQGCAFSLETSNYRGEFQFNNNTKIQDTSSKQDTYNGTEIRVNDNEHYENEQDYENISQFQVCSWYVNTEKSYSNTDYEIRIETEEGFIQGQNSTQAILAVCHEEVDYSKTKPNKEVCKMSIIHVNLDEGMIKKIKFQGGKFRFIIQFQEDLFINSSKIKITYFPISHHNRQLIIILTILFIVIVLLMLIIVLIFKNQILKFIRVKFNTLYFLDWEENTVLNHLAINQIIKKLENQKLIKLNTKSSQVENQYQHTECSICLVEFEQVDNIYSLICQHIFHQNCFEEWVKVQYHPVNCPICKIPLNESAFARIDMQKQQQQNNNSLKNMNSNSISKQDSCQQNILQELPAIGLKDSYIEENQIYEKVNLTSQEQE